MSENTKDVDVRTWLTAAGKNQTWLSKELRVPLPTVRLWFHRRGAPRLETALQLREFSRQNPGSSGEIVGLRELVVPKEPVVGTVDLSGGRSTESLGTGDEGGGESTPCPKPSSPVSDPFSHTDERIVKCWLEWGMRDVTAIARKIGRPGAELRVRDALVRRGILESENDLS